MYNSHQVASANTSRSIPPSLREGMPQQEKALAFVAQTGTPFKDPTARKLFKRRVMQHVGKYRRKLGIQRRHQALQYTLEAPERLLHAFPSAQPSSAPPSQLERVDESDENRRSNANKGSPLDKSSVAIERARTQRQVEITDRLGAGRFDPFARFPIELNSRGRELVDTTLHNPTGKGPFRDIWFQIAMLGAAPFHQWLSSASSYYKSLRTSDPDSQESIAYHLSSLKLVNRQLRKPTTATSDDMIGSIVGFAFYYHLIGDLDQWTNQMTGLERIIQIRGGIETVDANKPLGIMLRCVDVSGSCTLDSAPYFDLPTESLPNPPAPPRPPILGALARHLSITWRSNFRTHLPIIDIVDDVGNETASLQASITHGNIAAGQHAIYIYSHVNPLIHRLLSLPQRDTSLSSFAMSEALRLGAILYLVAVRQSFGISPTRPSSQLCKLRALYQDWDNYESPQIRFKDIGLDWVELWILAIGTIMSNTSEMQQWLAERLRAAMENLYVGTCDELENRMKDFMWISDIHGRLLRAFWEKPTA